MKPAPAPRRSTGYLLVFALAYAGGVAAYLPLLSLLLPLHVAAVAGEARLGVFTATVIAGAVAASASNLLFGWLSDRSVARGGGRRGWLAAGVVALAGSYAALAGATTPGALVATVVLVQIAVNAVLAPLLAIMADEVPDAQKGMAGGLLALGAPFASGLGALVLTAGGTGLGERLACIAAAAALCIAPLLLAPAERVDQPTPASRRAGRQSFALAWTARTLLQIAGSVLSLYLLFYFASVAPDLPAGVLGQRVGTILTVAFFLSLPVAVLAGRWSDRSGRRRPFLCASAALAALGLVGMALARDWTAGAMAFGAYTVGSAVFLALHAGFVMQLLPDPAHRGRDLGLLNLANTLPALLGPMLTWWLATPHDFAPVLLLLAGLSLAGGLVMLAAKPLRAV